MIIIAAIRMVMGVCILVFGTIFGVLVSYLPGTFKGINWASWVTLGMARAMLWCFNIQLEVINRERIFHHRGFLFPTHDGWIDILLPAAVVPSRFLAAIEVSRMMFIGRLGKAVNVVWVDRKDKASRQEAREALRGLEAYPPIVLYPEGMLDGTPGLAPFRYGAFEMAINNNLAYLPLAVLYHPFEDGKWKDEDLLPGVWRVAKKWKIKARMIALDPVTPKLGDDVATLAREAERSILAAIEQHKHGFPDFAHITADYEPVKPESSWENDGNISKRI